MRPGTEADIDFIDALQKKNHKQLGFMNRPMLEGKVTLGHVLIAETVASGQLSVASEERQGKPKSSAPLLAPGNSQLTTRLGYLIGNDRYKHRDELGVIFQMCVATEFRRSLVAGNLLKSQFERSAYGCKLYCCWCAQDIEANRFWESMGFVPLAFRAGSAKRDRVHIFWQKRIRAGDSTTPWWFPSKTAGGSIREDRIVLPIPPGTHWSDAKPLILPGKLEESKQVLEKKHGRDARATKKAKTIEKPALIRRNGLTFDIPKQGEQLPEAKCAKEVKAKPQRVKQQCDPRLVAAARELRDRWLEQVNAVPLLDEGKYDVTRKLSENGAHATDRGTALPVLGTPSLLLAAVPVVATAA